MQARWRASRAQALSARTPLDRRTLIIRPWHQAGNVVSLREFTINAINQHHGIQATERVGTDTDPDGDGCVAELTRADVTAISMFQAVMAVPGRVIPRDPEIEQAVWKGEHRHSERDRVRELPLVPIAAQ